MTAIPVRAVGLAQQPHATHYEAPYRAFIASGLVLAIGGGFLLSLMLPLARTLDWAWGSDLRWPEMVQLHGQLQLVGFAGLVVMGLALRIMPRVAGRPLAFRPLIPLLIPLIAGYLIVRASAHPLGDGVLRDGMLYASALLFFAGAAAFAAVAWGTLPHRESRAEATGYFFVLGAGGLLTAAVLNAMITHEMVQDSRIVAPAGRQSALVFLQQFGFIMMFVGGVASRAIPGLTGRQRRQLIPRACAVIYAFAVGLFVLMLLLAVEHRLSETEARLADAALGVIGGGFLTIAWFSGALAPGSNVAKASQLQFWFVRCAMAWLFAAGLLAIWYGGRAFWEGRLPDQFEMDAIRHVTTLGVITTIIVGMAMLIVPEFAGRRLQHPREAWMHVTMIVSLAIATGLRAWPALEGIRWIEDSRYWPMAASAVLASGVVVAFAVMFAQSWWEQRDPGWAARAAGVGAPAAPS